MIPTTDLAKLVDYLEAGNKGDWNPGWRDATIMHAKKCEGPLRSLLESHARMEAVVKAAQRIDRTSMGYMELHAALAALSSQEK